MTRPGTRGAGRAVVGLVGLAVAVSACGGAAPEVDDALDGAVATAPDLGAVLGREVARIDSAAAAVDEIFRPLPLLTPAQESTLRRFGNPAQLGRARALGLERGAETAVLERLVAEGELLRLEDGEFWVVGSLDHSRALVVPAAHRLLEELGERFHQRLADMGAPPFRFEISSVLRSAADQAALRRVNPNAALGESAHEYATTVDVLYSAFAAPARPIVPLTSLAHDDAEPFLTRYAAVAAERVGGRRALELKAVMGDVLMEMQGEGRVMVTLERQQPVFHMTVAAAP